MSVLLRHRMIRGWFVSMRFPYQNGKSTIMLTARFILLIVSSCTLSCAPYVTTAMFEEAGNPRDLIAPVDVYIDEREIPRGATVIGQVHVGDTGFSVGCGYHAVLSIVKDKAREVGADAAYLARVLHPDILSTCYRITARLLQYPSTATRPQTAIAEVVGDDWHRMVPPPTTIIELGPNDKNPSSKRDNFERSADAVVALAGSHGAATAFLITRDGLALANHHVVANQNGLKANLRDGRQLAVRVLRTDSGTDVALIQVNCSTDCFTLAIGRNNPRVGREVYTIGNPWALDYTLTTGVVSGLRLAGGVTLVQTDAAINLGNSGGPIMDTETGEVIAIVTGKVSAQTVEGLGFGIAIQDALRVLGVQWQ